MSTQVSKVGENTFDAVLGRINTLQKESGLTLPPNYSAENAVRSAWLVLQETKDMSKRPVLEVCSKESIANALLKMVVMGLNPIKRQCSFIAYGGKLELQREYQGSIALARRYGMKSVVANVVYKGDDFAIEIDVNGITKVTKHIQSFASLGGDILGAYAVVTLEDGTVNTEVMTLAQIHSSWNQGATKGNSPAHKNFPDQMAKKTVINRALKTIINSSDDGDVLDETTPEVSRVEANVNYEIKENAHKEEIGFTEEVEVHEPKVVEIPREEETAENQEEVTGPGF